jgi:hypothetical protein
MSFNSGPKKESGVVDLATWCDAKAGGLEAGVECVKGQSESSVDHLLLPSLILQGRGARLLGLMNQYETWRAKHSCG